MKKVITILTLCICFIQTNAQDFRPRGYMGFVEDLISYDVDNEQYSIGFATTHGYQFNPHIFVGAGVGVDYNYDKEKYYIPVYGDFRWNIISRRATPFIELKSGYGFGDIEGVYESAAIGCDVAITERFGIYAALGYTYQNAQSPYKKSYNSRYSSKKDFSSVSFKVGIHF